MKKWRLVFWTGLVLAFGIPPLIPDKPQMSYPEPRFPKDVYGETSDAELKNIARYIAHQTSGNVRLGTIPAGKKALIVLQSRKQDMRLLKAVIEAMKDRDVAVDYIFEDDFLSEVLGIPRSQAAALAAEGQSGRPPDALAELKQGEFDLGRWPRFLPDSLRDEIKEARGGERGTEVERTLLANTPFQVQLQDAMRRYVTELHPEYDAIVGGRPRQEYMAQRVGPKWNSLWDYPAVRNFQSVSMNYPTDVWRLTEDKIMQILPWVEEVHIYDPAGTDIRFSVTAKEGEVWAKAAYQPSHIFLNPLQGTRALFFREGRTDVTVPKSNGVVAGVSVGGGSSGVFPLMKFYVTDGLVTRVEGGGRQKQIWDAYLSSEQLSNAQPPHFPKKGFLWFYEVSFGTNPKSLGGGGGRSGIFHWGWGIEHGNPEIEQYLKEHDLPNDHTDRFTTYFSTYEVKFRGKNKWVKFVDRGRLSYLDDPEVRALASRYGNPDEILQERWIPDIPGINSPGKFEDWARDPATHMARVTKSIQDGTYAYLK